MSYYFLLFVLLAALPATAHAQSFYGYNCPSGNCGGHQAGYDDAEEQGVENENDCTGDDAHIEGCKAYLQNNDAHENNVEKNGSDESSASGNTEDNSGNAVQEEQPAAGGSESNTNENSSYEAPQSAYEPAPAPEPESSSQSSGGGGGSDE